MNEADRLRQIYRLNRVPRELVFTEQLDALLIEEGNQEGSIANDDDHDVQMQAPLHPSSPSLHTTELPLPLDLQNGNDSSARHEADAAGVPAAVPAAVQDSLLNAEDVNNIPASRSQCNRRGDALDTGSNGSSATERDVNQTPWDSFQPCIERSDLLLSALIKAVPSTSRFFMPKFTKISPTSQFENQVASQPITLVETIEDPNHDYYRHNKLICCTGKFRNRKLNENMVGGQEVETIVIQVRRSVLSNLRKTKKIDMKWF